MNGTDRLKGQPVASTPATLLGTIVIGGLATGALAASRLIVPILALAMGASILLVGITAALFSAIPMLFSVPFGRWVDRRGTRTPLIFSAVLIMMAAAAPIFFPSKYILLLTAALVGAGAVFTHVVATRAVGELGPRESRSRNLSMLVMIYSVTQFLGPTAVARPTSISARRSP